MFACTCICTPHVCPEPEEARSFIPGNGVTEYCELPCWELNPGPL